MALPEAYLPRKQSASRLRVGGFSGLDARRGIRSDGLVSAVGLDPTRLPEIATRATPRPTGTVYTGEMLSLHVLGSTVLAVTYEDGKSWLWRTRLDVTDRTLLAEGRVPRERTVSCFNQYGDPAHPDPSHSVAVGIILPERLYVFIDEYEELRLAPMSDAAMPALTAGCVHMSRLFGIHRDLIYASHYNDPSDWNLDTAADQGAANAWCSVVQTNKPQDTDFTAVISYDGHVLCMKPYSTHILYNTRNPFRVAGLLDVGAASAGSVAEGEGILYFASQRGVYRLKGSALREIGAPLGISDLGGALGAACGRLYYLYVPNGRRLFLYDSDGDAWCESARFSEAPLAAMASSGHTVYFLAEDGVLYSTEGADATEFSFEGMPLSLAPLGERRATRLACELTAAAGATLTVEGILEGGERVPLLSYTGTGDFASVMSRVFTPAGRSMRLAAHGRGEVYIHTLELMLSENQNN